MITLRATLAVVLLVVAHGCGAPGGGGRAPAALREDGCEDSAALAAWREAQQLALPDEDAAALPLLKKACARCPDLVRAHCAYQDVARRLGGRAAADMAAADAADGGEGEATQLAIINRFSCGLSQPFHDGSAQIAWYLKPLVDQI